MPRVQCPDPGSANVLRGVLVIRQSVSSSGGYRMRRARGVFPGRSLKAMAHWTDTQIWIATTGERLPAGELLKRYRRELHGVSLCCAVFTVRAGGTVWSRVPEPAPNGAK